MLRAGMPRWRCTHGPTVLGAAVASRQRIWWPARHGCTSWVARLCCPVLAQAQLLPIHRNTPCRPTPCRDGGSISHVRFQNISASTRLYHPSWWGAAEPIYVTALPRNRSTQVGEWGFVHSKQPTCGQEGEARGSGGQGAQVCVHRKVLGEAVLGSEPKPLPGTLPLQLVCGVS